MENTEKPGARDEPPPLYNQLEVKTCRKSFDAEIVTDITTRNTTSDMFMTNSIYRETNGTFFEKLRKISSFELPAHLSFQISELHQTIF